jgi:hypothetical protein
MAAANLHSSKTTESPADSRESGTQLRPGLWQTINERYPGSMITKSAFVPLAIRLALRDDSSLSRGSHWATQNLEMHWR